MSDATDLRYVLREALPVLTENVRVMAEIGQHLHELRDERADDDPWHGLVALLALTAGTSLSHLTHIVGALAVEALGQLDDGTVGGGDA